MADDTAVRLLELAATYSNFGSQGPETVGSILSSARLANSLTSNSLEAFSEKNRTSGSGVMPTVRYSHQLSESSFVGIVAARGGDVNYDRTSTGSQGAYLRDQTRTNQSLTGIRFGIGPLDYLAASSMELSIGYEDNHQRGPYATTGLRFPRYDSSVGGFTPLSAFSGGGIVDFHTRNTVVRWGGSATGDVLGAYIAGDFQIVSGSLRLTSSAIDSTSAVGNLSVPTAPVQLTAIKFKELSGFLFGLETGLIVKISERVGLKAGAYYQLAYIDYGTPKGVYLNAGQWTEISSAAELTSADKRRDMGFWGLNFGVISRL